MTESQITTDSLMGPTNIFYIRKNATKFPRTWWIPVAASAPGTHSDEGVDVSPRQQRKLPAAPIRRHPQGRKQTWSTGDGEREGTYCILIPDDAKHVCFDPCGPEEPFENECSSSYCVLRKKGANLLNITTARYGLLVAAMLPVTIF